MEVPANLSSHFRYSDGLSEYQGQDFKIVCLQQGSSDMEVQKIQDVLMGELMTDGGSDYRRDVSDWLRKSKLSSMLLDLAPYFQVFSVNQSTEYIPANPYSHSFATISVKGAIEHGLIAILRISTKSVRGSKWSFCLCLHRICRLASERRARNPFFILSLHIWSPLTPLLFPSVVFLTWYFEVLSSHV
jgi:hypothetical protein